ncbi:hypothetical protein C2845_PMPSC056006 [Panicum miliaceum]|uniref:Uncharacterized protein n=1 Tax=Panicum miliaceum TaxID=4540 RepID=A0A3L6P969_PANMI|nr:hypothetical protein C2845_PMPSC056006 [Panicum miliaceum]
MHLGHLPGRPGSIRTSELLCIIRLHLHHPPSLHQLEGELLLKRRGCHGLLTAGPLSKQAQIQEPVYLYALPVRRPASRRRCNGLEPTKSVNSPCGWLDGDEQEQTFLAFAAGH